VEKFAFHVKKLLDYPFTIDASDSSGDAYNGTLNGNATVSNGILTIGDNALDYVSVPADALNGASDFKISFAVRFDVFNSTGSSPGNTIFHAWGSLEDELKVSYNYNTLMFQVSINGPQYTFPFTAALSEWYCMIVERKSDTLRSYLNGTLLGQPTAVSSSPLSISGNGITIGQEQDCLGGCFAANQSLAGSLDNFKIDNCALPVSKNENCGLENGISDPSQNSFSIFPNPADDFASINFHSSRNTTVIVLNELGQEVMATHATNSSSLILPTENLNAGIYLVELRSANERPVEEKLLIVH